MKNRLLILTALVFTVGLTVSVYAKGYHKLEAFSELPKDKQTLIVETMKKNKETKKELWSEMEDAKKSMHEALTGPEFDAEAFQAGADRISQLKAEKFDIMTSSLKEIAPQLNQQERETLADMFDRGKRHHDDNKSKCGK